jgi:subtilisin family serine protease
MYVVGFGALVLAAVLFFAVQREDEQPVVQQSASLAVCGSAPTGEVKFVPGELLVKFKDGADKSRAMREAHGRKLHKFDSIGVEHWAVDDTDASIAMLKKSGDVEYAERNILYNVDYWVPNDPCVANGGPPCGTNPANPGQWNLDNIHAKEAWEVTKCDGCVIGFIGSGPYPGDPELGPQLWSNPGEIAGNGLDDDGNGWVDDTWGIDLYHTPTSVNPVSTYWHDHACAAIAGATTDNGIGIAGVAPHAKLAFVKTAGPCGGGASIDKFIQALDYFQTKGIKTVSVSFGCGPSPACFSQAVQDRINTYYNFGALIYASAGNDSHNHAGPTPCVECSYPCDYDKVICTASNNWDDARSSFSDYGPNVEFAAPGGFSVNGGTAIWTSVLYENYVPPQFLFQTAQGTSFSSPTAAAAGESVRIMHPSWPAGSIRTALQLTGDTVPALAPPVTLWGKRLNMFKAVCWQVTPKPPACP